MKQQEYSTMFEYENNYWWYVGLHRLINSFIERYSKKDYSKKILDAGCGTGKMLQILNQFQNSEGFDIEEKAIEFSKKRELKNVKIQDINAWQSVENTYDFIISSDVICCEGILNEEEILSKFHKSLKSGGKLILNLPAFDVLRRNHDIAVYIAKRYKRKQFVDELKKIGFKIDLATYRLPSLFIIILILKIFEKKSVEKDAVSDLKPIPNFINKLFLINNLIENWFIKKGLRFPFGSSLFIIAEKQLLPFNPD
jgi:SAM-dependent methyltransferase